jgi:subtilisin family serine protease
LPPYQDFGKGHLNYFNHKSSRFFLNGCFKFYFVMKKQLAKVGHSIVCTSLALFILFGYGCCGTANAQTLVNKEWSIANARPINSDWYSTVIDHDHHLVSVGNTAMTHEGANIWIQKTDPEGTVLWQRFYNSSGNQDDFGVGVTIDAQNNIYVCGTTKRNGQFDMAVLKYDANGNQQWAVQYNSPFNQNDVATALKTDPTGNVYVVGASEGATTMSDFLLLKLNADGVNLWQKRYDYANLPEIPAGLEWDDAGNLLIVGASGTDFTNWDYALVRYNTEGLLLNAVRNQLPGTGFDQPVAVKKDAQGNIYITGKASSNGVNYDIKTLKLNPSLSVAWVRTFDGSGLEDAANDLQIDADGNVFVAGYSTKSNGLKEITILKYDTDGHSEWIHKQAAKEDSGDAFAKALDVDDEGKVYFVAEEQGNSGSKDVTMMKLDAWGRTEWSKSLSTSATETPMAIKVDNQHQVYLSAIETQGTTSVYKTVKYATYKPDTAVLRNAAGKPIAMAHELIVRFNENMVNREAVDATIGTGEKVFGNLDYFLLPQAASSVQQKLQNLCSNTTLPHNSAFCPITVHKVFPQLRTTDTVTTSRMGEKIPIPAFWATFVLHFPENMDIRQTQDSLNTLFPMLIYAEPNYLVESSAAANDSLYAGEQASLHPTVDFPNAHVNVEPAWDIEVGKPFIRIGVFDTGLDWRHNDFGYNGLNDTTSRMTNGWDFASGSRLKSIATPDRHGHGTAVAGIIGAVRNNRQGIAGIAGGDSLGNRKGVSLYGMKILSDIGSFRRDPINDIADAIVLSSIEDATKDYGYGLHIMNHSWRFHELLSIFRDTNITLIREATHFANRAKVTFAAARGNEGYNNQAYPAILDDDWVLCVGGTGTDGNFAKMWVNCEFTASSGWEIDLAAPASDTIVRTLRTGGGYRTFNGTSAATPHVAGTAGLLMSYLNAPTPNYNNLAPEDIEQILQKTATDVGPVGVDSTTGHGRLNTAAALRGVFKPCWRVEHFGTTNNGRAFRTTLHSSRDTIQLQERYQSEAGTWFLPGRYFVRTYQVGATVNHNLTNLTDSIIAFWPRPSSSNTLQLFDRNKQLQPRERLYMDAASFNRNSVRTFGYAYQVWDSLNRYLGWWPNDTIRTARLEYSMWIRDKRFCLTGSEELRLREGISHIKAFPNPVSAQQTLRVVAETSTALDIRLFDVNGRMVQSIFKGHCQIGNNDYSVNFDDLTTGFYIYRIQSDGSVNYLKTIKN